MDSVQLLVITSISAFLANGDLSLPSCVCPEECDCSKEYQNMIIVECLGVTEFPQFSPYDCQISEVIIQGNFTYIPANAFFNLKWINYGIILRRSPVDTMVPITIEDSAFYFYRSYPISLAFYSFKALKNPPTVALQNVTLSELTFDSSGLYFLVGSPFYSLSVYIIRVVNGSLVEPDVTMLEGIQTFQPAGLAVDFKKNGMNDVPKSLKVPIVTSVDLSFNSIREIDAYAFSCQPCNFSGTIREINLNSNPIKIFDPDSFSNLPTLNSISLQNMTLAAVPTEYLLSVASSLKYLDLELNQITNVPYNAFFGFTSLTSVNLNANPITSIDVGAFNGTDSMISLFLNNFEELYTVDLLVTAGMISIRSLSLAYCANLTNITLSDPRMMPSSLQTVEASHSNIQRIEPTVDEWLGSALYTLLDISYNDNFICNEDISWMAKYVICKPTQIYANDTNCTSGQPLHDYLDEFIQSC